MRERRKTGALGAAAAVLTACLLLVIYGGSAAHRGGTAAPYTGATMLFENAGAYVLVALLAFMVGTAVTVLLIRRKSAADASINPENEEDNKEKRNEEDMT